MRMNKPVYKLIYLLFTLLCLLMVVIGSWPVKIFFGLFFLFCAINIFGYCFYAAKKRITAPRMRKFVESGAKLAHPKLLAALDGKNNIAVLPIDRSSFVDNNYQLKTVDLGVLVLKSDSSIVLADYLDLCGAKKRSTAIDPLIEVFPSGNFSIQSLVFSTIKTRQ